MATAKNKKRKRHFFRFGLIEASSGWIVGYCEVTKTGYLVPPMGKRACQSDAKTSGEIAVFHASIDIARSHLLSGEREES